MLVVTEEWKAAYPGAAMGILVMRGVVNPQYHEGLDKKKKELEAQLRSRFASWSRADLAKLEVLQAYHDYYKRFKKTYHVQLQLESLVFKGKPIPQVAVLVEAMFMAELKNLLLTAGHDLSAIQIPIRLDVAKGDERYNLINGQEQLLKPGDMFMAEGEGVISSVLYGPDRRTRITPETKKALFAVYAPAGVGKQVVIEHLQDIEANVKIVVPEAKTERLRVYTA